MMFAGPAATLLARLSCRNEDNIDLVAFKGLCSSICHCQQDIEAPASYSIQSMPEIVLRLLDRRIASICRGRCFVEGLN